MLYSQVRQYVNGEKVGWTRETEKGKHEVKRGEIEWCGGGVTEVRAKRGRHGERGAQTST